VKRQVPEVDGEAQDTPQWPIQQRRNELQTVGCFLTVCGRVLVMCAVLPCC
jgi:hypothetical protein